METLFTSGDKELLDDLWPYAKRAAMWHMNTSLTYGIPYKLQNTYDVLGLNAYSFASYNSAFHILALQAAEMLAVVKG